MKSGGTDSSPSLKDGRMRESESAPSRESNSSPVCLSSSSNSDSASYHEQISNINPHDVDMKTVNKHLVSLDDTLKLQGGDIARHIHQQLENVNGKSPQTQRPARARSSSFSTFLDSSRRESTASDINVPGGFRREFLINKSLQTNSRPPNLLTKNFLEFLSMYGHFAGENLDDEDSDNDEEAIDETSSLLSNEIRPIPSYKPKKQKKGTASVLKTFFLVFKALVGSGVLFLPKAFFNGGLLFSSVVLSLFGFLTFLCYIILVQCKNTFQKDSYGELGFKTYGRPLRLCILISIIISQIGFVSTYVLFTSENLTSFIENYLNIKGTITTAHIVVAQCVCLVPLVLIRNLTKLSLISLVSSGFIIIGLIIIYYFSGLQLLTDGLGPNITNFNSSSWPLLIGVSVTAFEGIGLMLPIESSMARPEKFPMVLGLSMLLITIFFVFTGVLCYSAYGDTVKSIIILSLPQDKVSVQMISLLYSLAVFLSAPLQLFPVTKIIESLIFNNLLWYSNPSSRTDSDGKLYHSSGKYNKSIKWSKNVLRSAIIVLICTVAYLNSNNLDKFISFNGCFACIPLVYIYPPLIHLKTLNQEPANKRKNAYIRIFDCALIVVGIVAVVYTTYDILFSI
ncbi:Piso0_005804 [Millerozyma farinosa CBS 7064]|uniref:Piso0_005804 protein n=1 Tax=Pichia sorbitophila (strain ATCC MYA-4447 / BCRC 22081 / CBS 7064 / NBRC 10061 / NRRL Y-12695) TaxID=559304 RepID=G8Y000_PICSO|nr:Piso0_005804 [Millerozyma farinosa CBS 7064]